MTDETAKTCNVKDIAEEIATSTNLDPVIAERGLFAAIDLFGEKLKGGESLQLSDFGRMAPNGGNGGAAFAIPGNEAADQVADRASCSAGEAEALLAEFVNVLRNRLLGGEKILLDDFVTLRIADEKAKIVTDETSGQKIISPARKVISFATAQGLSDSLGGSVAFSPEEGLKNRIASLKSSAILLAVPEADFFARTIEYHFERAGWRVHTCTSYSEAQDLMTDGETYLCIIDHNLPDSQRLLESIKSNIDTSLVPCIQMMPRGSDKRKTSSFRICGDEMVIEPFEVKALLTKAEAELARRAEEEVIFRQEVLFQFPTTDADIDRANEFGADLFEASGLDDEGQVALCAAFREAVGNAAQHGNRHRADLSIEVLYLLDNEKITAAITDQGKGFEHRMYTDRGEGGDALAAARERHQEGRLGGLGIMLMMKCVDKIEYNESGNALTLTKKLVDSVPQMG